MKRILTDFLSLSVYIRVIRVDPCPICRWLSKLPSLFWTIGYIVSQFALLVIGPATEIDPVPGYNMLLR